MSNVEELKSDVRAALDWTALQFPVTMFREPPAKRHGSVDGCTARGVRHAVEIVRLQLERTFAIREAPRDVCRDCFHTMPKLVLMEIYKHAWHMTGGPQVGSGPAHWAKIIDNQRPGINRTLTTLRAVCGIQFSYEVDSSD